MRATAKGSGLKMRLFLSNYFQVIMSMAHREEGQTMAEYAVVLGVIIVATVAVFVTLSSTIQTAVNNIITAI
jgi:Flp pilus assembly pilin Flp